MRVTITSGAGPQTFDFEEVVHPAFVNVGFDEYLRFEEATADLARLAELEVTFEKLLADQIEFHRAKVTKVDEAKILAGLVWYLAMRRRAIETKIATESAERILGNVTPAASVQAPIFTREEVLSLMVAAGEELTTWRNGYGIRRIALDEVIA